MDWALISEQVSALISSEPDVIANMANVSAVLFEALNQGGHSVNWCGFYRVNRPRELILGPFQGKVACLRIPFGSGVCGACAESGETLVVKDTDAFPGHIACDSASKSEVCVPVRDASGDMIGLLDIDSSVLDSFDAETVLGLEACMAKFAREQPETPPLRVKHAKH